MTKAILTLNAGSSSLKFALFEVGVQDELSLAARGVFSGIGTVPRFAVRDATGASLAAANLSVEEGASTEKLLPRLLAWVRTSFGESAIVAIGHRVVHGGRNFTKPVRLSGPVLGELEQLIPFAPLHQPQNLAPVKVVRDLLPQVPQVACFDTAFHRRLPDVAARFALPREYAAAGVRRYGFHGLSYEYIRDVMRIEAPRLARGRIVVAHLGNGASLCAMRNGESIETTMGFTTLDGLVMGTRCGVLDPGVVLYMLEQRQMTTREVARVLYERSGLLGVSGISSDIRVLLASQDPRAREAIDLFVFRIARETAALTASLGGLDGIVFTAGIGENAAEIRAAVCARLSWLGIALDRDANARNARRITKPDSPIEVRVIPTDEELVIARHTKELMDNEGWPTEPAAPLGASKHARL